MSIQDMKVPVSATDFHDTHNAACAAQQMVRNRGSLQEWSLLRLRETLAALEAGDKMNNPETGPDAGDTPNYREEIESVKKELARRNCL